jgi:hypothetical protein
MSVRREPVCDLLFSICCGTFAWSVCLDLFSFSPYVSSVIEPFECCPLCPAPIWFSKPTSTTLPIVEGGTQSYNWPDSRMHCIPVDLVVSAV